MVGLFSCFVINENIYRIFYRMATFSVFDRKRPAPGRREKEISMIVADCIEPLLFLELYPGTSFEVFIEVMDADGGTRCASTTVAALALADAGIPMKDLVASCAAGKYDGKLIIDLGDYEDKEGESDSEPTMKPDPGQSNHQHKEHSQ